MLLKPGCGFRPVAWDLGLWLLLTLAMKHSMVEHSMQCAVTLSQVTVWKPRLGGTQFAVDVFGVAVSTGWSLIVGGWDIFYG